VIPWGQTDKQTNKRMHGQIFTQYSGISSHSMGARIALDSKEISHVLVDMVACDHSKQRLESEIPPETQNDPESEVTDGCDPSRKALNKTEVSHKNFYIDANDQSK
jgi:hypothetical protein